MGNEVNHICLHEQEIGVMKSTIAHLDSQVTRFIELYNIESKAVEKALAAMTSMYDQLTAVLNTLQNTMHGPNRDNGIVQRVVVTEAQVRVNEDSIKKVEKTVEDMSKVIDKLKDNVVRITVLVAIGGGVGMQAVRYVIAKMMES